MAPAIRINPPVVFAIRLAPDALLLIVQCQPIHRYTVYMTQNVSSNIVAFIFARGGSKGVPGKNLREVDGRPLLARSIDIAKKIRRISRVILSTDDSQIAEAGRQF